MTELQVMLEGVFEPSRFLALVRDFIVFEDNGGGALVKKMAGYHQFHAVGVAVNETLRAAELQRAEAQDRRRKPKGSHEAESANQVESLATTASGWSGTRRVQARA